MLMKKFCPLYVIPALWVLLLCTSAWAASADAVCTPKFPLQTGVHNGWLGADAAYSIPQPDGWDVWIFGDTLYGTHRVVHGNDPVMVHNSIGISTCGSDGQWRIRYYIRKDSHGKPVSFFHSQHPNTWYWAMDGFRSGHDLWVTLLCVRAAGKASAFGFGTCGTDLARISSPGPNPLTWKVTYFPLVPDGAHAYPSATTVVAGKYVDLFAADEVGAKPLIASRIPLNGLDDPQKTLSILPATANGKKGSSPSMRRQSCRRAFQNYRFAITRSERSGSR